VTLPTFKNHLLIQGFSSKKISNPLLLFSGYYQQNFWVTENFLKKNENAPWHRGCIAKILTGNEFTFFLIASPNHIA